MQNDKPIHIGVLGCANVAKQHVIPALLQLKEKFILTAVASRTEEKANLFADAFGCEPIVGYERLISRSDIDAVYCPLPTGLHAEWIGKALEKGKHVYTEKSVGMSFFETHNLVTQARNKNLALMEGFMYKYHPQHQIVKELIHKGKIGELRHFTSSFGFPPIADKENFRYDESVGGGALMDVGAYVISAVRFITGLNMQVKAANIYRDCNNTSIYGSAYLTHPSGMSSDVRFGFDNFYQCCYEVWGTKGKIIVPKAFTPKRNENTQIILETDYGIEKITCPAANHFILALNAFYKQCIGQESSEYDEMIHQAQCLENIKNAH